MKKSKLKLIASIIAMLTVLFALTAMLSVNAAADTTEASWGADNSNLTNSGNLQDALEAAAADSSIKYVRLNADLDIGTYGVTSSGGTFTFDLNGYSLIAGNWAYSVTNGTNVTIIDESGTGKIETTAAGATTIKTDSSAVQITVQGGTVKGTSYAILLNSESGSEPACKLYVEGGSLISTEGYSIGANSEAIVITGGSFEHPWETIAWNNGLIDLSGYPDPTGISICNYTGGDVSLPNDNIRLPEDYGLFDNVGTPVNTLVNGTEYSVGNVSSALNVTVNDTVNGSVSLSPSGVAYFAGTTVTVIATPDDNYMVDQITVTGAEYDAGSGTFTLLNSDVTVAVTFKPHQADWGTGEGDLTHSGTLQEALDAAASDGEITYVKLRSDVDLGSDGVYARGGTYTLDLASKVIASEIYTLIIEDSTDITLIDTLGGGAIKSTSDGASAITTDSSNVKITVDGINVIGVDCAIRLEGSMSTISESELTVLSGNITALSDWGDAIGAYGKSLVIKGGSISGIRNDIAWDSGAIDLSEYTDVSGLRFSCYLEEDVYLPSDSLKLPDGYCVYYLDDPVDVLMTDGSSYVVDQIKYNVNIEYSGDGDAFLSPSDTQLVPGTIVTLEAIPDSGYRADVEIIGATLDPESSTFTVGNEDVTINVSFRLYEASWGISEDSLTEWGTLHDALDAAASDGEITYVKLASNVYDLGYFWVDGTASLTLDLNGCTVQGDSFALYISGGANLTIVDSVGTGTLRSSNRAICMWGESLTIKGGRIDGSSENIEWMSGTIDLSGHADPSDITIINHTNNDIYLSSDDLKLPEGYSLYLGNERVTEIMSAGSYLVDETKYVLEYEHDDEISVDSNPSDNMITPGTTVYFDCLTEGNYLITSVVANGGEVEISIDPESGRYCFIMPECDVTVQITAKHTMFTWGSDPSSMTNSGNLFDLVAAINAGEAPYAKLIDDFSIYYHEGEIVISGSSVIDIGAHRFEGPCVPGSFIALANGADITFTSDDETDHIYPSSSLNGYFNLQNGSKLTLDGVYAGSLHIIYNGGDFDVSRAHLGSVLHFANRSDSDLTLSESIVFGDRFKAIDNSAQYTTAPIQKINVLEKGETAKIAALFTVSFELGEGSGTISPIETYQNYDFIIPTVEDAVHPDGLSIIGWSTSLNGNELIATHHGTLPEFSDTVYTAIWGEAVRVGDVVMTDGDYLPSGATEVTRTRPTVGGYAYYKDGILTLNSFNLSSPGGVVENLYSTEAYAQIFSAGDIVIELIGDNELRVGIDEELGIYYCSYNVFSMRSITIRGTGSLTTLSSNIGIMAKSLTIDGGDLVIDSTISSAISAIDFTLNDGSVTALSWGGVTALTAQINGGELRIIPSDNDGVFGLCSETLTINGGKIIVKGGYAIESNHLTVTGGIINLEAYDYGISNAIFAGDKSNSTLTISGGEINISSDATAIFFTGDINITGGELNAQGYIGISISDGSLNVTGGYADVYGIITGIMAHYADVSLSDGCLLVMGEEGGIVIIGEDNSFTVSGGMLDIYGCATGIYLDGKATVSNGAVYISASDESIVAGEIEISGKSTVLLSDAPLVGEMSVSSEDITHTLEDESMAIYIGRDVKHAWSDELYYDSTHHWYECTDEDCVIKSFGTVDLHTLYEEMAYAEHTISATDGSCSCGYSSESDEPIPDDDAILIVGNHRLKSGEYLDNEGRITTELPEGGYLYVINNGNAAAIILNNFSFSYVGDILMNLRSDILWSITLSGENVLSIATDEHNVEKTNGGIGILVASHLELCGDGKLTINANTGISATDATIIIYSELTVNANIAGISMSQSTDEPLNSTLLIGSTLVINTESGDGISASCITLNIDYDADVTILAGDDGISLDDSLFNIDESTVSIFADDDGLYISRCVMELNNASLFITTYDDDGIDGTESNISINNSSLIMDTDDHGFDLDDYCVLIGAENTINIISGDEAIDTYYSSIHLRYSRIDLTAEDKGLDLNCTMDGDGSTFDTCVININSRSNYFYETYLELIDSELNIVASDTGIEIDSATIYTEYCEMSITASEDGISAEGAADLAIISTKLHVRAPRLGIGGNLKLTMNGDIDVDVRASRAIYCEDISFDSPILYGTSPVLGGSLPYIFNATFNGVSFVNDDGTPASHVKIASYEVAIKNVTEKAELLDQLISEGGELELIEAAISELDTAIAEIDAAYSAADKDILDQLDSARGTLDAAIKALDKKLDDTSAELKGEIDALEKETDERLQAALGAIEQANRNNSALSETVKELTDANNRANVTIIITLVIASVAFAINVGAIVVAIILERKKKLISSLFRGMASVSSPVAPSETAPEATFEADPEATFEADPEIATNESSESTSEE